MKRGNTNVHGLIEKLEVVLNFLDMNDLPIAAIKIEEAINALKDVEFDESDATKKDL